LQNIRKSDVCLLIGINPKIDAVLLNYHLRKRFLAGNFKIAYIGSSLNSREGFSNISISYKRTDNKQKDFKKDDKTTTVKYQRTGLSMSSSYNFSQSTYTPTLSMPFNRLDNMPRVFITVVLSTVGSLLQTVLVYACPEFLFLCLLRNAKFPCPI
jgi:hypothetical protein